MLDVAGLNTKQQEYLASLNAKGLFEHGECCKAQYILCSFYIPNFS